MLCSRCNKNVAVIFVTRMEGGKTVNEGLCMPCAKELGINPMQQLAGSFDPGEMENLENQMMELMAVTPEDMDIDMDDVDPSNPFSGLMNFFGGFPHKKPEDGTEQVSDKKDKKKEKKHAEKEKKLLDKYGTNLTAKAKAGLVDMVVGRDREIERLVQILNRRTKNNPALLGEPGVGKTAIAEGFADRIAKGTVPEKLLDKEVYLLDFTAIVAGTQYRGQFEARLKGIIEETKKLGNIILVIDEMHNIVGAGDAEGAMSAANILKPALSRGEIQVIGATTLAEYRKHIEKDSALERRFQTVIVEEPSPAETIEVLKGIKGYYEEYHKVKISDEVVVSAVLLSKRYITDRFLPDKAIDLIDEAGSRANLKNAILAQLARTEKKLAELNSQMEDESNSESDEAEVDYEKIAQFKTQECTLNSEIENLKSQLADVELTTDDIAYVVEEWTKIPVKKITQAETERLLNLESRLHERIIGQNDAVSAVSRAIRRNRASLSKKLRPASFVFVGPTGVGKTELVKQLAVELFDSEDALIRVDMTEYMEKHSVSKLIGSPPGYVGYDDAGQLTEKVRRKPYCVVLFDEIEKAHPDVLNILLQILDDGRITDSHGKLVSFENTVIVMTSNAGSDWKGSGIGFTESTAKQNKDKVHWALKTIFRPEFLNRVDEIVVFDQLNKEEMGKILDLMLSELSDMLDGKGIKLTVSDNVKEILVSEAIEEHLGARPLRRLISRKIEDQLSEMIIRGNHKGKVLITEKGGEIVCE